MYKRLLVAVLSLAVLAGCAGPVGMMKVGPVENRDGSAYEGYFFVSPGHIGPKMKVLGISQCYDEPPVPEYLPGPPPPGPPVASPPPPAKKKDPCYDRGMVAVYDRGLVDHAVAGVSNTFLPAAGFATGMALIKPSRSETDVTQQGGSLASGDVDVRAYGGQGGTGTESRITNTNTNTSYNSAKSTAFSRSDPVVTQRQFVDPGRGGSRSPSGIPYPKPPIRTPTPRPKG